MCLADGLNALLKASYAQKGFYSQGFFNTTVGLERLMKLIHLIDHALQNSGGFPTEGALKTRFGHDLVKLFDETRVVRGRLEREDGSFQWSLPDPDLAQVIIHVLGQFSRQTRYYNLDYLVGAKSTGTEPITTWALEVGGYLLRSYPTRLQQQDDMEGIILDDLLGEHSVVLHESAEGIQISTINEAVYHGKREEWVQRQATFHIAAIVRDLIEIMRALNQHCMRGGLLELPFLWEGFHVFYNDDRYLKSRRTFLQ